jgi:hypothetical protein
MQYCMATPRNFLQSVKYDNLTTIRTGEDRFNRVRWTKFLYSARLASALGIWPFTDVLLSGESDNLLIATLSAGPVGIGDRIGTLDKTSLLRAMRADGVIVKPDVPLAPLDHCYVEDSQFLDTPLVASTYSDFGGSKAYYLFAYNRGADTTTTFHTGELGVSTRAYVYNYFSDSGVLLQPNDTFSEPMIDGRSYYVVAPIGKSGIALLGDKDQFVSLGKKRIPLFVDDGTVHLTVAFAAGEGVRTLHGYSPSQPKASASTGEIGPVDYDSATQRFRISVQPGSDQTAVIDIVGPGPDNNVTIAAAPPGDSGPTKVPVRGGAGKPSADNLP